MGSNLPPGVMPGDIDKHFGEPEARTVHADVAVGVSVETQFFDDKQERKKEIRHELDQYVGDVEDIHILDVEIVEVE